MSLQERAEAIASMPCCPCNSGEHEAAVIKLAREFAIVAVKSTLKAKGVDKFSDDFVAAMVTVSERHL